MAILNNLIVNGAARFLNKSYFDSLEADSGAFKKIIAKDATVTNATVMGLLDVTGELHTKSWSNSNIATIDGSFYITPTFGLQGGDTSTNTVTVAATSLSFTNSSGTNFNFDSLYLDGSSSAIAWTTSSKVIVTGEILKDGEWIPLGTLKGTLSTYSTTSVVINSITDAKGAAPATLAALVGSGLRYRNVKVSLISIYRESKLRPLGIFMTATGANGRTFLDIYGGSNEESSTYLGLAKPVVRIGNLSSSSLNTVAGITPTGWGIYTSNGFFTGTIAAEKGKIGTGSTYWTIGSSSTQSYIHAGPTTVGADTVGIYIGTDGINNFNSSTQYVRITNGVITAKSAVLSGSIEATSFVAKNGSTTRATVDSYGLRAYDGSGNIVGQFGTDVTVGRVASNIYNILIDADTGIQNRKNTTVLSQFDSTSIKFYDGSGTAAANVITSFSSTGAQIGKSGQTHANIYTNSFELTDLNANTFFKVRDAVDESGQYTDYFFVSEITQQYFYLSYTAANTEYIVTMDGETVNPAQKTERYFTLSSYAPLYSIVAATYTVTGNSVKAYDLGIRKTNSISGNYSVAMGYQTEASGFSAISNGYVHESSSLIGAKNKASLANGYVKSPNSFIIANSVGAIANGSIGYLGENITNTDEYSGKIISEGTGSIASGEVLYGGLILAESSGSQALGKAYSSSSIEALGTGSIALGNASVNSSISAYGPGNFIHGTASAGASLYTNGSGSMLFGTASNMSIRATASGAFAGGFAHNYTDNRSSFCGIESSGYGSIAFGYIYSETGTERMIADGAGAVALNIGTIARWTGQTVIGTFNIDDTVPSTAVHPNGKVGYGNYAFIIGNGIGEDTRSNAFTVDWNGNVNIASGAKYKINGTALAASDVGAVPTSRTVNSKALTSDITLTASDVGAVPTSRTINSKALTSNITLTASDVSAVPVSRTINSKALSSDITLAASDVGAPSFSGMVGQIIMYGGSTAPTGWLICDGSELLKSEYPELAAVLGNTWGTPSSSNYFKLPDFRGRAPIGAGTGTKVDGSANLTSRTLGTKVSDEETVTLGTDHIPAHTHGSSGTCSISSSGGHSHTVKFAGDDSSSLTGSNPSSLGAVMRLPGTNAGGNRLTGNGAHTHTVPNHEHTSVGGGQAHKNMQPSTVVNFIICTGKTS